MLLSKIYAGMLVNGVTDAEKSGVQIHDDKVVLSFNGMPLASVHDAKLPANAGKVILSLTDHAKGYESQLGTSLTPEGYALSVDAVVRFLCEKYSHTLYSSEIYEEWEESKAPTGRKPLKVCYVTGMPEERWLEWRRRGVGGSDASIIMGCSPFSEIVRLYHDKIGSKALFQENRSTFQLDFGHTNEELCAKLFSEKIGLRVRPADYMFCHPQARIMQANVDRLIDLPDGTIGLLECKTTNWRIAFEKWGDDKNPLVPEYYYWQVQHYMEVMDIDVAYIACLWGSNENDFCYREIKRSREDGRRLREAELRFWNDYVVPMKSPYYNGDYEKTMATIAKYEKKVNAAPLQKPETGAALAKYDELQEKKRTLSREVDKLDTEMKDALVAVLNEMGSAAVGLYTSSDGVSYQVTTKTSDKTYIPAAKLKELEETDPVLYGQLVTTTRSASVQVKKMK